MANLDYYTYVGYALELLARSNYHKQHQLGAYFRTEILPAFRNNQVQFYTDKNGAPIGLVTWAWLSSPALKEIHESGRAVAENEWKSGDNLFFNDFITPYGNMKEVLLDFTTNIFPNEVATSLRRRPDGTIRRVNRWIGVNYQKQTAKCAP